MELFLPKYLSLPSQDQIGYDAQVSDINELCSGLRQQLEELAQQRAADAQQAQRDNELSSRHLAAAQQQLQYKADIIHQLTGGLQVCVPMAIARPAIILMQTWTCQTVDLSDRIVYVHERICCTLCASEQLTILQLQ